MAKIHRATVTGADLDYVGSITIDSLILEKAGIKPFQMVNINNLANGTHWETYVNSGKKGKGEITLNGPPARHFHPGDKVIITAEAYLDHADENQLKNLNPVVVFVNDKNKVTKVMKHKAIH